MTDRRSFTDDPAPAAGGTDVAEDGDLRNRHIAFQLRAVGVLAAPVARHGNALVDDPDDLDVFDHIVDAFAGEERWLTRSEVAERADFDGDEDRFAQRFDTLVELGAMNPTVAYCVMSTSRGMMTSRPRRGRAR